MKVVARARALPRDRWTHLWVNVDGSRKATGVSLFVNGRPADVSAETDTLRGSFATNEPLRVGRRSASAPLNGSVADVRLYARALAPGEVRTLAFEPFARSLQLAAASRTSTQQRMLDSYYREHVDSELSRSESRLAELRKQKTELEKTIPTVMVMEDLAKPRPTYLLKRGRYDMPDTTKPVDAGVPSCLPPLPPGVPANRLGLARWLVSPDNPLTARVIVNRVWQQHFGNGLVKTSENFGLQSEPPTHPELLDWLSAELIRSGWDLKALHRLIVSSATYRQSSKVDAALAARDPENRLLARGPRFRLPAETVRDNALAISGLLSDRIGGPSVKPYQPAGLWEELAGGAGEGPYVQETGANLYRRSLYVYRKRTVPHPAMVTFDAPSREVCQVKRARTNTPLQALELLNDVTYVEAARRLAERMLVEGGATPEARITFAFRRATGRAPLDSELRILSRGLEEHLKHYRSNRDTAAQLVSIGESRAPAALEASDLAAYTATASVILNLDETINRE
ncbi:MAG: DUF1553 domain-containing protein [Isosphaeraceae bacterium]